MNSDERKLLGGYATGVLTPEEQSHLFEAALRDQELFNALGNEQVLRSYLDDPEFRRQLLQTLQPVPPARNLEPLGWLFATAVAVCSLVVFFIALKPPRSTVAVNQPQIFAPPPPSAARRPSSVEPMEPPPPLVRQAEPEPPLAAVTRIKPGAEPPDRRMTVAVLDFLSGAKKPEVGRSVSNLVSDKLETDKVYSVIKRNAVRSAQPSNSAPVDSETAARIGRQLGADAVILGRTATRVGNNFVSASLIDTATGRKLRDASSGVAPESLQAAAQAVGTALELEGKVTDVNAAILTIDVGSKSGIKPGERLTISRGGRTLGSLVITTTGENSSVGRYTGADVRIGDRAAIQ